MNTFDLSLDLDKRAGVTQWVTMRQGDHDGTQLRATIYDHGTQVSGSYTCRVSIRKPTDNEYYRETCSFSGGVAIVTIDEQYAASEVGITYGYFELLQGTAVIASTESFGVRILQSAIDGAIVAPPYDSAIEDALAELDEATGRISQMVVDATAEYLEAHPELTTTVEDNSLTDAKLIQKGGILQREQWLESLVPVLKGITKETPEADVHSVTDSAGGGPLGIEVYGRSTQDGTPTPDAPVAIESVSGNLVDYIANYNSSAVRLEGDRLLNAVTDTKTYATPVFQTYLNGTVQETLYIAPANVTKRGVYSRAFTTTKAFDRVRIKHNGSSRDIVLFDQTMSGGAGEDYYVTLKVYAYNPSVVGGLSVGDIALYDGSAARDYAPYDSAALVAYGRNVLDLSANVVNVYEYGITWTVNADGTVTAKGTATGTAQVYWQFREDEAQRFGGMVLSGCPSVSGCSIRIERSASPYTVYAADTGSGATITFPSEGSSDIYFICRVNSGTTVDVTFRPMIRQAGSSAEWEPYRSVMLSIDLGGRSLRSLPDGTRDEVAVDEWGHAVLTQRVGEVTFDGSESWSGATNRFVLNMSNLKPSGSNNVVANGYMTHYAAKTDAQAWAGNVGFNIGSTAQQVFIAPESELYAAGRAAFLAWLAENPVTFVYPLATPVTIDLGYLDPALLPAPDLTAYVVPSAPSVLRYGFNVAAALAEIATS